MGGAGATIDRFFLIQPPTQTPSQQSIESPPASSDAINYLHSVNHHSHQYDMAKGQEVVTEQVPEEGVPQIKIKYMGIGKFPEEEINLLVDGKPVILQPYHPYVVIPKKLVINALGYIPNKKYENRGVFLQVVTP